MRRDHPLALGAPEGEYSIIGPSLDLRPHDLVSSARHSRKEPFVQYLQGAPLLLIPIASNETGGLDEALVDGLEACTSRSGQAVAPTRDGLPFSTATVPGEAMRRGSVLERMITGGVVYAVVLHKRPGSRTMSEHRICVGRSHGNDIVLRSSSVSKLHAWFQRDEDQVYFVVDAGSHNGTRVREVPVAPRRATQLASGDVVLFGSVEATYCTAGDFWDVLASTPP